jgi:transcriptional regulator with XRE-family HTH domain
MKTNGSKVRLLLGENMRHYRDINKLSQEQLAERCETTSQYISEIERGDKWPSPALLEKIALSLGVGLPSLFVASADRDTVVDRESVLAELSVRLKQELLITVERVRTDVLSGQ